MQEVMVAWFREVPDLKYGEGELARLPAEWNSRQERDKGESAPYPEQSEWGEGWRLTPYMLVWVQEWTLDSVLLPAGLRRNLVVAKEDQARENCGKELGPDLMDVCF